MIDTVRTYGTLNDMPLALVRDRVAASPGGLTTRLTLYLTQSGEQRYLSDFPDNGAGIASANAVATGILTASAVAGLTVSLG